MTIWNAHTSADFTAALAGCALGDTINLDAGSTYVGPFDLTDKGAGTSPIIIQSTGIGSLPSGVRVSPSSLSNMAKVCSPATGGLHGFPALVLHADAHHYQIQGLAVTTEQIYPNSTVTPFLISNVFDGSIAYNHWPHHITLDRCLVYPGEVDPLPYRSAERGVVIDGANITIKNNYIYNFMGWSYPSVNQAVTAATNTNPVQISFTNPIGASAGTKFLCFLTGGTGAWTALNGLKVATVVDSTHASLQDYDSSFNLTNINSTTFGSFSGQTINQLTNAISNSMGIVMQFGPGPYTIDNNFVEAYYATLFTGGASGSWIDPQNVVTVTAVNSLTQVVLSSIGQLQVGDMIAFSTTQDQTISGATAGNPTILTVQPHNYPAGTYLTPEGSIQVSGFTGAWSAANNKWGGNGNGTGIGSAIVIDSTHISIALDSTGFGAVTGSGMKWVLETKRPASGPFQWVVGKVTNISGNTVDYVWWGHQPQNAGGNGAGILIAVGAQAQFRGINVSNVTVTHNTLSCKRDWIWLIRDVAKTGDNTSGQPPKGIGGEYKMGVNMTFTGNIFQIEGGDLAPHSSQVCMGLNQANQIGASPWIVNSNWNITSNLFKNFDYFKFSMIEEYETGSVGSGLVFTNNLCTAANASFINLEGTDNVTITHNTSRNNGTGGGSGGGYNDYMTIFNLNTNSVVQNNIGNWVAYGINNFDPWTPVACNHNYLIGGDTGSSNWHSGDVAVANDAAMGFTNVTSADAGGDYHGYQLTSGSIGHNAATDGTDVGVNFATLDAALTIGGGVVVCSWSRSPICQ